MKLLGIAVLVGMAWGVGSAYGDDLHRPIPATTAVGILAGMILIGLLFDRVIMRR